MTIKSLARLAAAALGAAALGVAAPHALAATPDLGGIWEHSDVSRLPGERPAWTALGQKLLAEDLKTKWHDGVSEENIYCLPAGMPFMMGGSEGFDIASNAREILIVNEERPSPRHIYVDGRGHPDMNVFDRTTVGHSIGRWEGDELVVDTVGFLAGATVQFVRSDTSHLVERFRLEDGGAKLRITSTWEDPQLLAKPWTSVVLMEKAPADRTALEYYCDPRDPARAKP